MTRAPALLAVLALAASAGIGRSATRPDEVVTALAHPEPLVREAALRVARDEKLTGDALLAGSLALVGSDDPNVALAAAVFVQQPWHDLEPWREALQNALRAQAVGSPSRCALLAATARAGATLGELEPLLSAELSELDCLSFGLDGDSHAFAPLLVRGLESDAASRALEALDPPPDAVLPQLWTRLNELRPTDLDRQSAHLGRIGSLPAVLPYLEILLARADPPAGAYAALATRADQLAEASLDPVELVDEWSRDARGSAVAALLRPEGLSESALFVAVVNPPPWARSRPSDWPFELGRVLGRLPSDRFPTLVELIDAGDEPVSLVALAAVARMLQRPELRDSAAGRRSELALASALREGSARRRRAAAQALRPRNGSGVEVDPAVLTALAHTATGRVRSTAGAAADALGLMGSSAEAVLPDLLAWITSPASSSRSQGTQREDLLRAVVLIVPQLDDRSTLVPSLQAVLRHPDDALHWMAADALGSCGPAAVGALPALRERALLESRPGRRTFEVAIRRIDRSTWEHAR